MVRVVMSRPGHLTSSYCDIDYDHISLLVKMSVVKGR